MFERFKSKKVTYKIIEMRTGLFILFVFVLSCAISVEAQARKKGKAIEKEERKRAIVVLISLLRIFMVKKSL